MHPCAALFERLLGPSFATLPAPVKRLHDRRPRKVFAGRCHVERGRGRLAAWLARATALPLACRDAPVTVTLLRDGQREIWSRDFAGRPMRSILAEHRGCLQETLGPVGFTFALRADPQGITWRVAGVRACGLPLPGAWFEGVTARESSQGGRYTFEVRAELPLIGLLVHYRGWLDVDA